MARAGSGSDERCAEAVKRQHYVPKCYLKRFADDQGHVHVFDKSQMKSFRTGTEGIACERYFYDLSRTLVKDQSEVQVVEKALAELDSGFAIALDTVLTEMSTRRKHKSPLKRKILHKRERETLACFIAMQIVRTREFRQQWIEASETLVRALLEHASDVETGAKLADLYDVAYNLDVAPLEHARFMFNFKNLQRLAKALCAHVWLLGMNDSGRLLYTSDNPVVRRSHMTDPFISHSGYASPGIEVAFPLSPRVILLMYERTYFKALEGKDGRATNLDENSVMYYNSLQVGQSYRQVYSYDGDFSLAEDLCQLHPEIRQVDRPRFRVG